jgi:D-alanyl-D-alanine carboxypeptidase/D-alanyl-D-alanine-endopeptidase (penicillin-binding protein 4)
VAALSACAARSSPGPRAPQRSSEAVRRLRADLARVFAAPIMARAVWAVDIRSLETGERLFQLDADKLVMPASNMKILTLAAAADILGWDHRFTTTLETAASVETGVLKGDLFVRGTGDPTINSRNGRAAVVHDEFAGALRAAGIYEIQGRIIGDDQAFDDEGIGAGWAWDYLQYGYAAPVGALQFNEDVADLTIEPGATPGAPPDVRLTAGSGLAIANLAFTGPPGSEQSIDYRRRLDRPVLEVFGSIPMGAKPVVRTVAVVNATIFFAQALKDAFAAREIRVTGDAVDLDDVAPEIVSNGGQASSRVLATVSSPPLREIATVLMKASQNLYAETLLKTIDASRGGLGTTRGGQIAVRSTLSAWGIPQDSYVLADGSGLSRYNYVTAALVTTVLEHLYRDLRHRESFSATLPIAGRDGTLASRLRRTRAEANAIAKTGSIANVRSLSGYLRTQEGEPLVFSIIANDFTIPAATVTWIADLALEILANFTRK